MERVRKMKNQNYQTDEKMREVKGECESKKRYLKDTTFQLETVKWLFISFILIIFGASRYIKYTLLVLLALDLLQTKYLFCLKNSKYVKYLLNAVIIFLFILNLRMFILRNIVELIFVIILIYIFNEKYMKNYNRFKDIEGDRYEEE
jgi:hypothetical protein